MKEKNLRAQVVVTQGLGGNNYDLEFPADKAIREAARKLDERTVIITGEMVTTPDFGERAKARTYVRVRTVGAAVERRER